VSTQELPFHIILARQRDVFSKSVLIRHDAFLRHAHPFAISSNPHLDDIDEGADTVVLMAKCKETDEPLGSARVTECSDISALLSDDEFVPDSFRQRSALLFSRLAVCAGPRGRLVRAALGKAAFLYSIAKQAHFTFAFVAPPRERLYYRDGFQNMLPGNEMFPYRANSGINSRILFIDNWKYEGFLRDLNAELHQFIFSEQHPDILVFESISGATRVRRKTDTQTRFSPVSTIQDSSGVFV
jgi:hypothetical protein